MNADLRRMARKLWMGASESDDAVLDRKNAAKWIKAVSTLGDKWLLGTYRARVFVSAQAVPMHPPQGWGTLTALEPSQANRHP